MSIYYLVLNGERFHKRIRPLLAESWRRASFKPCVPLCRELLGAAADYLAACHGRQDESLIMRIAGGLPFDRHLYQALVGEVLLFAATDIPEIQVVPETLTCLLAPERHGLEPRKRESFSPIEQVHFGTRDLWFGQKVYRPDNAGYNDVTDVVRLDEYLCSVNPAAWSIGDLTVLSELMDDEQRNEELELAKEWFPALRELYRRCRDQASIIVCEEL